MAGGLCVFVNSTFGLNGACLINATAMAALSCSPLVMEQREKQVNSNGCSIDLFVWESISINVC